MKNLLFSEQSAIIYSSARISLRRRLEISYGFQTLVHWTFHLHNFAFSPLFRGIFLGEKPFGEN